MEYTFTPEEQAWRDEVRGFLTAELGEDFRAEEMWPGKDWSFEKDYIKKLAQKGWIAPAWPKEHGGLGLGVMKQTIFAEEMTYFGSPHGALTWCGVSLVGPVLMVYGSDEQKAEHLGGIARGEVTWAQGFSEPNSGSDLASLQCRAVADGDDYVVNGTKIWTTGGHLAQKMILLCRTDPEAPKHKGISFFLVDELNAPGITIQPLIDAAGHHRINQEYFEDVRIPKKNLVGELNRGWYVAAATLDFERSGIGWAARSKRQIDDLLVYCKETRFNGARLIDRPDVRLKLTERSIEAECARYISYRVASMQEAGLIPNQEASMAKLFGSETQQRVARTGTEILGLKGQVLSGQWAPLHGEFPDAYVASIPDTIESGSSEIQRNIIATRGLGLPKV